MENYLRDIQDIKKMMNRSTQFLSLSGLAGVMAGVYALAGAYAAKKVYDLNHGRYITPDSSSFKVIQCIAVVVLVLSVLTAYILTARKARKQGETVWNATSKRLAVNFLIPLITGGVFALILMKNRYAGLVAPVTLIFYGLACINASKYTMRQVRYLGFTIIIIGLMAANFEGSGLEFWSIGFGVCHILYGAIMYFKYDRKQA